MITLWNLVVILLLAMTEGVLSGTEFIKDTTYPLEDQFTVTGLARDFWPCKNRDECGQNVDVPFSCSAYKCHPDFENCIQDIGDCIGDCMDRKGPMDLCDPCNLQYNLQFVTKFLR
jgi:hypothetical protein